MTEFSIAELRKLHDLRINDPKLYAELIETVSDFSFQTSQLMQQLQINLQKKSNDGGSYG